MLTSRGDKERAGTAEDGSVAGLPNPLTDRLVAGCFPPSVLLSLGNPYGQHRGSHTVDHSRYVNRRLLACLASADLSGGGLPATEPRPTRKRGQPKLYRGENHTVEPIG